MLRFAKKLFKKSQFIKKIIATIIYGYLKFVYFTTRWSYIFRDKQAEESWQNMIKVIVLAWHDRLAILPKSILHQNNKFHILASPHSDGIIISSVLKMLGFNIIPGSTNKNSMAAIKNIMRILSSGENIAITPDGPRGPAYEINSNIIEIAKKCESAIIPVSCKSTHYFRLGSWDKLFFPLPFGKVTIYIGNTIFPAKEQLTKDDLKAALNNLIVK